jgi:hypothetical protein
LAEFKSPDLNATMVPTSDVALLLNITIISRCIMSSIATVPSPARPWPVDRVEHWPIERLIAYANKPRLHSESDLDKIAAGSQDRDRSGSADG